MMQKERERRRESMRGKGRRTYIILQLNKTNKEDFFRLFYFDPCDQQMVFIPPASPSLCLFSSLLSSSLLTSSILTSVFNQSTSAEDNPYPSLIMMYHLQ